MILRHLDCCSGNEKNQFLPPRSLRVTRTKVRAHASPQPVLGVNLSRGGPAVFHPPHQRAVRAGPGERSKETREPRCFSAYASTATNGRAGVNGSCRDQNPNPSVWISRPLESPDFCVKTPRGKFLQIIGRGPALLVCRAAVRSKHFPCAGFGLSLVTSLHESSVGMKMLDRPVRPSLPPVRVRDTGRELLPSILIPPRSFSNCASAKFDACSARALNCQAPTFEERAPAGHHPLTRHHVSARSRLSRKSVSLRRRMVVTPRLNHENSPSSAQSPPLRQPPGLLRLDSNVG